MPFRIKHTVRNWLQQNVLVVSCRMEKTPIFYFGIKNIFFYPFPVFVRFLFLFHFSPPRYNSLPIAISNKKQPQNMCVPLCKYACCYGVHKINHLLWNIDRRWILWSISPCIVIPCAPFFRGEKCLLHIYLFIFHGPSPLPQIFHTICFNLWQFDHQRTRAHTLPFYSIPNLIIKMQKKRMIKTREGDSVELLIFFFCLSHFLFSFSEL